jgi:class 3 adenylate cyclase/tetratricopeptide (TPR) repeat protein
MHELARHVPRLALDWAVDAPEERWRLVDGSMVFADISGFTALSERLATRGRIGAEELVETLSRVFGSMLERAARRGGQLLKFGGDALLFLFDGPDHVVQACSAAVEMRAELRRASDIVTSVGRLSLSISTGVHTDSFHCFLVGHPHRELVILGPGINGVVRCENAANAGEIVVSGSVAAHLPAASVRSRHDGELLLRWREGRGTAGELPAARAGDDAAARSLLPAIVRQVLDGTRPDPAHRVATIAFMKFSGTDEILADEGADELAERLDRTLRLAQEAFLAEDVALLCVDCDVSGGKLFCSTGVPLTSEDDEGRMLRAAAAVVAAGTPLPLQIGINRGHVFAAEVGTPWRAAFSAMGDTTNTAARICAKAQPGAVYVHPAVLDHARTRWEAAPVGPFTFKGKAQPQLLYEVAEELGPRTRSEAAEPVLVGREHELARLHELFDRGHGTVVVSGAVGVGKSRLVREALAGVGAADVVEISAEPYGAAIPYRNLRDPVRALLGVERGPADEMVAALRTGVGRLVPHHEPLLALLADVVNLAVDPSPEVQAILPRYRPDRTADVVIDVLAAARPGPLVVVVEDAHWVDDASARLVDRLVRETTQRPWTIVVVRRDEPGGLDPTEAAEGDAVLAEEIAPVELGPLDGQATRRLTLAITDAAPLRPHEVDQIVARAGGNPLFVVELVRATQELGSLEAVPTSLQGAMAAQVDALDPFARRVLSYASVLGRSFRRAVLAEVLRAEDLALDAATIERLGRFLEADGPQRWRFRNGLVRDITYDGLGFRLRAHLHLAAGEAVERISTDVNADAEVLALHFAAAGEHERTYRYATVAAERAERAHANTDAALHLERAIDAARRLADVGPEDLRRLWVRLGDARDRAGVLDAALEAYRAAARLGGDDLAKAEIFLRRANVRERAGAFSAALREASMVRSLLAARGDADACSARARAASFAAVVRQRQERAVAARELAVAAADEADACGDRVALARAYGVISWAGLVLGRDDSVEHATRALELFEEVGDLVGQAHMANNLGGYTYFEGDWDRTLAWYARCEDACRRTGNVTDAALTSANAGEVLVNQGRLDEAEPLLRDAARVLRVSGHLWGATFAEMHLGRLLVARGELEAAEQLLRRCVDDNAAMGSTASAFESALHLGECLVRSGRPAEALDVVALTASRTTEEVSMFDASRAHVEAGALAALDRREEAVDAIVHGAAAARLRNLEFDLGRLLLLADELGLSEDPRLGTDDAGGEARILFERLGVVSAVTS